MKHGETQITLHATMAGHVAVVALPATSDEKEILIKLIKWSGIRTTQMQLMRYRSEHFRFSFVAALDVSIAVAVAMKKKPRRWLRIRIVFSHKKLLLQVKLISNVSIIIPCDWAMDVQENAANHRLIAVLVTRFLFFALLCCLGHQLHTMNIFSVKRK